VELRPDPPLRTTGAGTLAPVTFLHWKGLMMHPVIGDLRVAVQARLLAAKREHERLDILETCVNRLEALGFAPSLELQQSDNASGDVVLRVAVQL
jgi:hypothetical protein